MKNYLLIIILIFFGTISIAQTVEWAVHDGGWSVTNKVSKTVVDASGNTYVSGYYNHYISSYPHGTYTAKYDSQGQQLWIRKTETTNISIEVIDVDKENNLYVYGSYSGYSATIGSISMTNSSGFARFIAKFSQLTADLSGCLWAKEINYPLMSTCLDKNSGALFLTSTYTDPITADAFSLPSDQGYPYDGYIAKYNTNGNCDWIKKVGDRGGSYIALDQQGNLNITGQLYWSATFGTASDSITIFSGNHCCANIFLAQYDSLGNFKWVKEISGDSASSGSISLTGISTDTINNIYLIGTCNKVAFDANLTEDGAFIAKYGVSGNFKWVKTITAQTCCVTCKDISIDKQNNIYITGRLNDTANFGSIIISNESGSNNMFAAKYDDEGNLSWVQNAVAEYNASQYSFSDGNQICTKDGMVWVAGSFSSFVNFGDSLFSTPSGGPEDIFIIKLKDNDIIPNAIYETIIQAIDFSAYPNPASSDINILFNYALSGFIKMNLINLLGETIVSEPLQNNVINKINVESLSKGIYFIEIIAGGKRSVKKIVLN